MGSRTRELLDEYADLLEEKLLAADGYDEAIIGVASVWNGDGSRNTKAVYNRNKCIEILMRDMSEEEANEYFEYNVSAAYVGEYTPIFVEMFE